MGFTIKEKAFLLDQNVQQIIKEHPSTSIRRLRQQVKLCYGTYQKFFKKDINLFPFVCCKK
jgi:hypothetical protein